MTYLCQLVENNQVWKRHLNQIIGYEPRHPTLTTVPKLPDKVRHQRRQIGLPNISNAENTEQQGSIVGDRNPDEVEIVRDNPGNPAVQTEINVELEPTSANTMVRRSGRNRVAPDRYGMNVAIIN